MVTIITQCVECGINIKRYYTKGRVANNSFCSISCHDIYQRKHSEQLVIRNKSKENIEKVRNSLLQRKLRLGDNYHSPEAKKKIGKATKERWDEHKDKILPILQASADKMRTRIDWPYKHPWRKNRTEIIKKCPFCPLCGSMETLSVHHIIPYKITRDNSIDNLRPLCSKHHAIIEYWSWKMFEILENWDDVAYLIKQQIDGNYEMIICKLRQLKSIS